MSKTYSVGNTVGLTYYGMPRADVLDGIDSYGYVTSGVLPVVSGIITVSSGDIFDITFKYLDVSSANTYFIDGNDNAVNRGYILGYTDGTFSPTSLSYCDVLTVDGSLDYIPNDLETHTLHIQYNDSYDIKYFGQRYSGSNRHALSIDSIKYNGAELDVTWENLVTVGGQTDSVDKFDNHFLNWNDVKNAVESTMSTDYVLQSVSNTTITNQIYLDFDANNYELEIDGSDFQILSYEDGYDFRDEIPNASKVRMHNLQFKSMVPKSDSHVSNILIGSDVEGEREYYNNIFDSNNIISNGIFVYKCINSLVNIHHNIFLNSPIDLSAQYGGVRVDHNSNSSTHNIFSNTFYDIERAIYLTGGTPAVVNTHSNIFNTLSSDGVPSSGNLSTVDYPLAKIFATIDPNKSGIYNQQLESDVRGVYVEGITKYLDGTTIDPDNVYMGALPAKDASTYYAVGPQISYSNYGKSPAIGLDGINSYGYITNGPITLEVGDVLEFKYRTLTVFQYRYFVDSNSTENRGYMEINNDTPKRLSGPTYNIEIDGVSDRTVPLDSDSHTITATVVTANKKIYHIGSDYNAATKMNVAFESVTLNGKDLDITWVNAHNVGGQDDSVDKFDSHFLNYYDAKDGLPSGNLNQYVIEAIGNSSIGANITSPNVNYGFNIVFDAKGYRITSSASTNDFYLNNHIPSKIIFRNFDYLLTKNKTTNYNGFIRSLGGIDLDVIDCTLDLNNYKGNGISLGDNAEYEAVILNNIIKNSGNRLSAERYGGILIYRNESGIPAKTTIGHCTIYNASNALKIWADKNVHVYNSYFHSNSSSGIHDAIEGRYTDAGGIVTSDDSAPLASNRNVRLDEAFKYEWKEVLYNDYTSETWGFSSTATNDATHKWEMTPSGIRFQSDTTDVVATLNQNNTLKVNGNWSKVRITIDIVNYNGGSFKGDAPYIFDGKWVINNSGIHSIELEPSNNYNFSFYRNETNCDLTVKSIKYEYLQNTFKPKPVLRVGSTPLLKFHKLYKNGLTILNNIYVGAYGRLSSGARRTARRVFRLLRR